jgi:non-ribosomal peptide synthetase component F
MRPFEHAPLVKVQSWSSVGRGKPLFESLVVFDHQSLDARLRATAGRWQTRSFEYIGQTSYPLAVVAYGDDEMLVRLEYARQRFSDVAIERMLGHLTTLLAGLARDDVKQLRDLAMLGEGERAALLGADRRVQAHPRGPTLHALFEAQVARTPDAIALTAFAADSSRVELSYGELNRRANALAHRLRFARRRSESARRTTHRARCRPRDRDPRHSQVRRSVPAARPRLSQERVAFMLADSGVRSC